ncbi:HAD family phosphatase [Desulfobotulus sp. H1]|uniref:HAD family phosphatase n=1 Tax=Desulfobotulus pelophilus TaxID=2823377 RepID=A0ABT3N5S1_9BACT|nr:HAD family phosphatase [Desulfobotulus pelophilus]MCW7752808.1 HAD family phosphatase [Desulfobotulus pelophilus]
MDEENFHFPELVLLDFGGVIAEEGFKTAMADLADSQGKNPETLKRQAFDLVYATGFTTGKIKDTSFWKIFRDMTGIEGEDAFLTNFVKERFVVRPFMLSLVMQLREAGIRTAVLSDQTHWLEELDERDHFFSCFDRVFNSYQAGITKKDPLFFLQVLDRMKASADRTLFVDDHKPHVERAMGLGMDAIWYREQEEFERAILARFPFILFPGEGRLFR